MKHTRVNRRMRRQASPRVALLVLSFALVIAASVGGTLAWLQNESKEVKNTFTSAVLFDEPEDFTLWEHEATENADGTYTLSTGETAITNANTYKVLPGVDIPKDPTVDIVGLQENAYLYLQVTNSLDNDLSYDIDPANWEKLTGYDGIYVYKGASASDNIISAFATDEDVLLVNILENKQIEVDDEYAADVSGTLTFKAYMVQATGNGADATQAWANTYNIGVITTP